MKVDTGRLKKCTSEVPVECQQLIDRLTVCSRTELISELSKIDSWIFGKCELYHWITVLDKFDLILEDATQSNGNNEWSLKCDTSFSPEDVKLLLLVLNFTTLLIEHSFSRHLYNSIEHLTKLFSSSNMNVVLGVLNLLYMFSKRSNFISRLTNNKKNSLLARLNFLAESWGGKEYGFSLAACCEKSKLPDTASTLFYEFYTKNGTTKTIEYEDITENLGIIKNVDELAGKIFLIHKADIRNLDEDQKMHILIRIRRAWAFRKHAERLHFVQARLQSLSVLIYSNSVQENIHQLLYPGFLEELIELMGLIGSNLVEIKAAALRTLTSIIHLDRNPHFPKKPGSRLAMIIDVTGASSYHGFLPTLVRTCINSLTSFNSGYDTNLQQTKLNHNNSNYGTYFLRNYSLENNFPLPLATALFSFLYHLASYESGGEALVSCGMMESLLNIINWNGNELEHITFVTRAVRVIDLITNIEMNSFQNFGGLDSFINRLDLEVNYCRQEQPLEIEPQQESNPVNDINDFTGLFSNSCSSNDSNSEQNQRVPVATSFSNIFHPNEQPANGQRIGESNQEARLSQPNRSISLNFRSNANEEVIIIDDSTTEESHSPVHRFHQQDQIRRSEPQRVGRYQRVRCIPGINDNASSLVCEIINDFNSLIDDQSNIEIKNSNTARITANSCLPQRAALLKSMLNFLKKAIQDQAFSESIRHLMEGLLPSSLRHIISNAEYYGPSLFLLATDVVTVYVFQEPSLLSSLQDNGLTDVVLQALLKKDVPATREVLGSLPNVFSALCLNSRGLNAFVKYAPFERLYKVLLSPVYLLAMRRRRSNEPMGDTASNLGNAMDELMRHQPSLKSEATKAIIKLLRELVHLGSDPKYMCWRPNNKNDVQSMSFSNILTNSIHQSSNNMSNCVNNNSNLILRQQQLHQPNHRSNEVNGVSSLNATSNTNEPDLSDGDDEDDDEEEASTSSHHNQRDERPDSVSNQSSVATNHSLCNNVHRTPSIIMNPINSDDAMIDDDSAIEERELIPLVDYILNAMKFIDAILSNNSTDDHCREFVQHGGLQPLLSILALPNLPVDSPVTTSAQAVAAVCKSILNLSHESEVLQVALNQLSVIVDRLKPLQIHIKNPGGSILLRELANCPNVDAAFSNASYTPLLHAMSGVHGYIVMLVHICRTGQTEIRSILLEQWGQKNELLTNLVQLYTALVWESTLLLALCTDDVFPSECEFGKEDIDKLPNQNLNENGQNFCNLSNDKKRTAENDDDCVIIEENKNMSINNCDTSFAANPNLIKSDIPQITSKKKLIASPGQLRYIKALLGASSRLGRALAELFGNLVKLCVGSPLRQRRGQNFPPTPACTSEEAKDIARVLSYILVDGFSYEKLSPSPIPKLKLTFLICSVGFTGPMLFDEKRYAFHLMLYQFVKEGGLKAFFQMFEWALTSQNEGISHEKKSCRSHDLKSLSNQKFADGTGEFLDAWLMLLEKMVNPKAILESPHVINSNSIHSTSQSTVANTPSARTSRNTTTSNEINAILTTTDSHSHNLHRSQQNSLPDTNHSQKMVKRDEKYKKFEFDPILYLVTIHRLAFDAVIKIWGIKPLQIYGIRMTESMMSILKHIIKGEKTVKEKYKKRIAEIREKNRLANLQRSNESSSTLIPSNNGGNPRSVHFPSQLQNVTTMSTQTGNVLVDSVFNMIRSQDVDSNINEHRNSSNVVINQENLRQLMDMGFSEEHATTALLLTVSIQDATEYLLNHPPITPPPLSVPLNFHRQAQFEETQNTESGLQNSSTRNRCLSQTSVEAMDVSDQESAKYSNENTSDIYRQFVQNHSTRNPINEKKTKRKSKEKPKIDARRNKLSRKYQITTDAPLNESRIDEFCHTAVEKTIFLMDELPETVTKGTDLLVILYRRNRSEWRQCFLFKIVKELNAWIDFIRKQIRLDDHNVRVMLYGEGAQKFHVRLQLCCLLMDDIYPDMRESICCAVNEKYTLSKLLCLLSEIEELLRIKTSEIRAEYRRKALLALSVIVIDDDDDENQHHIPKKDVKMAKPKWLAQMITFIDLVEKVNLSLQRKKNMLNVTTRTWKWYDINLGRWNIYSAVNNKIIDQAYVNGEASVPITSGRQRYTINFNCMSQVNDESGNHRPVILSLKAVEKFLHPHQQTHPNLQISTTTSAVQPANNTQPNSGSIIQTCSTTSNSLPRRTPGQMEASNSNTENVIASTSTSATANKPSVLPLIMSSDDSECKDCNDSDDYDSNTQEDENSSSEELGNEYYSSLSECENCPKYKSTYDPNNLKIILPCAEGIVYDNRPPLPGRERIYDYSKSESSSTDSQCDPSLHASNIKIDNSQVGLFQYDTGEIVSCLVKLLQPEIDVDRDIFLAIMKLCVRLTKNFQNAKIFAQQGGVRLLLGMRQTCGYMGFPIFATLLIRHVLEEPKTLALAIEKVIAARTMPTIPPGYRDLLFLLRQMSSAVSRDPEIFREVAQKILHIDILSSRLVKPDDTRLLVKSILPSSSILLSSVGSCNQTNVAAASTSATCPIQIPSTSGSGGQQQSLLSSNKRVASNTAYEKQYTMEPVSIEAIYDLLKALIQPINTESKYKSKYISNECGLPPTSNTSLNSTGGVTVHNRTNISPTQNQEFTLNTSVNQTQRNVNNRNLLSQVQNSTEGIQQEAHRLAFDQHSDQEDLDDQRNQQSLNNKQISLVHNCNEQCKFWHMPPSSQAEKPLLPRATILKFLADAVRSYQTFAPLIVEYQYKPEDSTLIKTQQSVLSFILDKFLPLSEHTVDREVSSMARVLIAALASCSDQLNVQTIVVCEVKSAINRVLSQPESVDKHLHLQILVGLIPTMIENCPPDNNTLLKLQHIHRRNEIFYIMVRKGLISDLAKLTQYLDLSSPYTIGTINATLKPIETLLRMTNAPGPISFSSKKPFNRRIFYNNDDHFQHASGSTNYITEDSNDMHPSSRTVSNNNNRVSNNHHRQHHHILSNQNDILGENVDELQVVAENLVRPPERGQPHLDDIMDQLLEHASNIENDPVQILSTNHNPATVRRVMHEFFDESSTESGDSESNPSDNDEREIDEDEDNEEEVEDRSEIDVDEETRQFIEIFDHVYNRHVPQGSSNSTEQPNREIQNEAIESNSSDALANNEPNNHETCGHNESNSSTMGVVEIQNNENTPIEPEPIDDGNDSTCSESVFYGRVQRTSNELNDSNSNNAANVDDFDEMLSVDSTDVVRQQADESIMRHRFNSRHPEAVAESVVADVVANVVAAIESSGEIDASGRGPVGSTQGNNRNLVNLQAVSSNSSQLPQNIRRRRRRPIQFSFAINSPLAPMTDFLNLRRRRYTILNENVDHTPIILQQLLGPSTSGNLHSTNTSDNVITSNVGRNISISAAVGFNDSDRIISGNNTLIDQLNLNPFNMDSPNEEITNQNNNDGGDDTIGTVENGIRRNSSNSNTSNIFRDATRVVLMDNAFGIFPDEHFPDDRSIDLVDQAGYLFGQSLAATLASTPTALHWWLEESKNLGLESQSDVCLTVGHQLIPLLEEQRELELAKLRNRKKRKEESKSASVPVIPSSSDGRPNNIGASTSSFADVLNTSFRTEQFDSLTSVSRGYVGENSNFSSQTNNQQSQFFDSEIRSTPINAIASYDNSSTNSDVFRTPSPLLRSNTGNTNNFERPQRIPINPNLRITTNVHGGNFSQRSRRNRTWMLSRISNREHILSDSSGGIGFLENSPQISVPDVVNLGREEISLQQQNQMVDEVMESNISLPILSSYSRDETTRLSDVHLEIPRLVPVSRFQDEAVDEIGTENDFEIFEDPVDDENGEEEQDGEEDEDEDETNETEGDDDDEIINNTNSQEINIVHNSASETEESAEIEIGQRGQNTNLELVSIQNTTAITNFQNVRNGVDTCIIQSSQQLSTRTNNIDELEEILEIIDHSRENPNLSRVDIQHPSGRNFVNTPSEEQHFPESVEIANELNSESITISDNSCSTNEVIKQENEVITIADSPPSNATDNNLNSVTNVGEEIPGSSIENTNFLSTSVNKIANDEKNLNNEENGSTYLSSEVAIVENNVGTNLNIFDNNPEIHSLEGTLEEASALNINSSEMTSEVREALGGLEVPEGVDPSFLAALPQEMREEVISEHLRLQRLRQRAQQISIQVEHAAVAEVNPEFLAALPPNIQEEVLAQQRIEQQRQAAASANPNDPVDAAAFFQNLPPNLRQAILTDMEESQIAVLPPELAAEAQNLRRDWESRNRQIMHERLINQIGTNSPSTSNVLNLYRSPRFPFMHSVRLTQNWQTSSENRVNFHHHSGGSGMSNYNSQSSISDASNSNPSLMTIMERQGKPLLDHEALASLLILLFIDDPKFNTLRLHRVIRNLCCHLPTREWIINVLLSIIVKTNESYYIGTLLREKTQVKPNWLNIRSDAALGSRANVFTIENSKLYYELYNNKSLDGKKRFTEWLMTTQNDSSVREALIIFENTRENSLVNKNKSEPIDQSKIEIDELEIGIHPQAAQIVCKHAIELLITLAKSFPKNFLPYRKQDSIAHIKQQPQQMPRQERSQHFAEFQQRQEQQQRQSHQSQLERQGIQQDHIFPQDQRQQLTPIQQQSLSEEQEQQTLRSTPEELQNQVQSQQQANHLRQPYNHQIIQEQQERSHQQLHHKLQPSAINNFASITHQPNICNNLSQVKSIKLMIINKNNISLANPTGNVNFNLYEPRVTNKMKSNRAVKSNAFLALTSISIETDFWDIVLNLDNKKPFKKPPNYSLTHMQQSNSLSQIQNPRTICSSSSNIKQQHFSRNERNSMNITFDQSPFGTLISMLSYRIINKSSHLTDKLFRLLSFISVVLPDTQASSQKTQHGNQIPQTISLQQQTPDQTQPQTENENQTQRQQQNQNQTQLQQQNVQSTASIQKETQFDQRDKAERIDHQCSTVNIPAETFHSLHRNCVYHNSFSTNCKLNVKRECLHAFVMLHSHLKESSQKQNLLSYSSIPKYITDELYDTFLPKPERLALIIETLVDKTFSEEGLEDATSLLLHLSQCCKDTRAIIFRLLVDAANILGRRVEKQIRCLLNDLKDMNISQLQINQQQLSQQSAFNTLNKISSTSSCETSPDKENLNVISTYIAIPSTSRGNVSTSIGSKHKGMLQDRFTRENVVITAPKRTKQSTELQLASMIPLISKTSAQAIFLRFLKTIIQMRENVIDEHNKAIENMNNERHNLHTHFSNIQPNFSSSEDLNKNQQCNQQSQTQTSKVRFKPIIELVNPYPYEMSLLSDLLILDNLWDTLSNCLIELELSADYHAVLVLQSAVEAFFLVHATPQKKPKRNIESEVRRSNLTGQNDNANRNTIRLTTQSMQQQQQPLSEVAREIHQQDEIQQQTCTVMLHHEQQHGQEQQTRIQQDQQLLNLPQISVERQEAVRQSLYNISQSTTQRQQFPQRTIPKTPNQTIDTGEVEINHSGQQKLTIDQRKFLIFAEKHRTVLNQILRQSTGHLSDGPFAVLVDHTRILDFDVKRRYFRTELERLDEGVRREEIAVHVNRKTVFEDSFRELYRRNSEDWKNRFYIVFEDEEGQDAGGLLREWYVIISREIFNPMYALFTVSPGDRVTYMINSSSHANPNHLCYYKFVGRVIAKAIYDNKLLECYFTRSFYKHILGIQVKYTDMESEDYEFYKSLIFLLEHEVSALGYDLTFSLEVQEFGVTEVKDLISNGRNVFVTDDNKLEYIRLVCQLKMSNSIKQQLNAFLEGFYDIIPKRLISIFNEQELELLISGLPNVDIEDLRANTEYHKYQINSIQIQWFWRALRSFDQAERAKFLQFVTGTSKVPLNGFGSLEGMNGIQKFQIHRDDRSTDRLPSAHTCFNQLDLPVYKTYDKLRSSLLKAIHECSEGFGFA